MVVDRIERDFAIIEKDGENITVPLSNLPENVKEGDILTENFMIDNSQKLLRQQKIKDLEASLMRKK